MFVFGTSLAEPCHSMLMLRSISFLAAILWLLPAFGQEKPALPIPVLLQKAKDGRTDIARMRWQLQAAYAYVLKKGEYAADLDSAMLLVDQVKAANDRVHDPAIEGLC